ncbi:MAG: phosphoribosylanthranilate isomerase [Anaerolineae bacterium]|nr:phosphoribosylanthranilate isomerase [Anaerolineae bacterium]
MTKVKICGLTNLEDANVAVEAGADLIGFIFYEPSPRYVASETVREIVAQLSETADAHPIFVGVFVNESLERVQQIVDYCRLDAVQLHGDESPEDVARLKGQAYKALRPQSQEDANDLIERFTQSPNSEILPAVLLDAYHPTLYGGTGHVTNWSIAANIAHRYPIMLAGSLTPTNVVEAIGAVAPWGVDVSSGVEAQKGKKDHQKVRAFIEAVRHVEGGLL